MSTVNYQSQKIQSAYPSIPSELAESYKTQSDWQHYVQHFPSPAARGNMERWLQHAYWPGRVPHYLRSPDKMLSTNYCQFLELQKNLYKHKTAILYHSICANALTISSIQNQLLVLQ